MDSLEEIADVPRSIVIDGVRHALARPLMDDLAQTEAHIRTKRQERIRKTIDGSPMDAEVRALAFVKLESEPILIATIIDSLEGRLFSIWRALILAGGDMPFDTFRAKCPTLPPLEFLDLMLWIVGSERPAVPDPTNAGTATPAQSPSGSCDTARATG